MREAIRQRARELGFDACRFTTADPPESAGHLQRWLHQGQHGEMAYLARNAWKRIDPQQVLPGAKSIIVLATGYGSAAPGSPALPPATGSRRPGEIARYARYSDYHHVIGNKLKELTAYLAQSGPPQTRSLWYVDTGPLLERDLAQRAGLGFIGKHTNLISRTMGNWILLSEILTTVELEPDAPETNRCGSCTRCLAACPTQAIRAPFELDARRCISYLTIELKGPIPLELRPLVGHRIFGCDDCLAVCPWNRFARQGTLMQAHAREELEGPDLLKLLALDEAAFQALFAGTPIARIKRRGLLRNVCVALGNVGDSTALPALEKASNDVEPLIAEHAAWASERIRGSRQH